MQGYYQYCNANGVGYSGASGARAYLAYLAHSTYYGVRMSPEATWALSAKAREFLCANPSEDIQKYRHFVTWCQAFYPGWTPAGPDIIPAAYGWFSFYGQPKALEYQAWRNQWTV